MNDLQSPTGHLRCLVLTGFEIASFVNSKTQALANAFYMSCCVYDMRRHE